MSRRCYTYFRSRLASTALASFMAQYLDFNAAIRWLGGSILARYWYLRLVVYVLHADA
jgi:hypothetical protein